jgi:hypothetical protein
MLYQFSKPTINVVQRSYSRRSTPSSLAFDGMKDSSGHENRSDRMKYREIIADNLSKAGWSYGWISALDRKG